MNYGGIFNEVWRTLGAWLLVFLAYHIARLFLEYMRDESKGPNTKLWNSRRGMFLAYPFFIFCVAVVSLCLWAAYGTHTEDEDPLRGGGEVVTDFEPTDKERNEYGVKTFLVLGIPAMVAVYKNYKRNPVHAVKE
jgi:hypothetical protein